MVADCHQATADIWLPYASVGPTSLARVSYNIAATCPFTLSRSLPLSRSLSHPPLKHRTHHCRRQLCHHVALASLHHCLIQLTYNSTIITSSTPIRLFPLPSLGKGVFCFAVATISSERCRALSLPWSHRSPAPPVLLFSDLESPCDPCA